MAKKGKELVEGSSEVRESNAAAVSETSADGARLKSMRKVYTLDEKYRAEVGVIFDNRDGSESILLNALPCNRKLWIPSRKDSSRSQS